MPIKLILVGGAGIFLTRALRINRSLRNDNSISDNKIWTLKFYCPGVSKEKQRFWTISLSAPNAPPSNMQNKYFYCSPAVSEQRFLTLLRPRWTKSCVALSLRPNPRPTSSRLQPLATPTALSHQMHGLMQWYSAVRTDQKTREGCGCPKFPAGKVFLQISMLLENDSPIFRQCKMLSLPRFGHFPARKTAAGKLAAPAGTLLDFFHWDRHSLLEFFWTGTITLKPMN